MFRFSGQRNADKFWLTCALNTVWSELTVLEVPLPGFHRDLSSPPVCAASCIHSEGDFAFQEVVAFHSKSNLFPTESPLQESWGKVVAALPPIANTVHLLRNLSAVCGQGLE